MAYLQGQYGRLATLVFKRPKTATVATATPAPAPKPASASMPSGLDAALAGCAKLGPPGYYIRKLCEEAARKKYGGTVSAPTPKQEQPTVTTPDTGGVSLQHPETPAPTPTPSVAPAIAPQAPTPSVAPITPQVSTTGAETGGVSLGHEAPAPAPSLSRAGPAPAPAAPSPGAGAEEPAGGGVPRWALVAGGLGLTLFLVAVLVAARSRRAHGG